MFGGVTHFNCSTIVAQLPDVTVMVFDVETTAHLPLLSGEEHRRRSGSFISLLIPSADSSASDESAQLFVPRPTRRLRRTCKHECRVSSDRAMGAVPGASVDFKSEHETGV